MASKPAPIPSKNALKALRGLVFSNPIILAGAVGSACCTAAFHCEVRKRAQLVEKVVKTKRAILSVSNGRGAAHMARMFEAAERGEDFTLSMDIGRSLERRKVRNYESLAEDIVDEEVALVLLRSRNQASNFLSPKQPAEELVQKNAGEDLSTTISNPSSKPRRPAPRHDEVFLPKSTLKLDPALFGRSRPSTEQFPGTTSVTSSSDTPPAATNTLAAERIRAASRLPMKCHDHTVYARGHRRHYSPMTVRRLSDNAAVARSASAEAGIELEISHNRERPKREGQTAKSRDDPDFVLDQIGFDPWLAQPEQEEGITSETTFDFRPPVASSHPKMQEDVRSIPESLAAVSEASPVPDPRYAAFNIFRRRTRRGIRFRHSVLHKIIHPAWFRRVYTKRQKLRKHQKRMQMFEPRGMLGVSRDQPVQGSMEFSDFGNGEALTYPTWSELPLDNFVVRMPRRSQTPAYLQAVGSLRFAGYVDECVRFFREDYHLPDEESGMRRKGLSTVALDKAVSPVHSDPHLAFPYTREDGSQLNPQHRRSRSWISDALRTGEETQLLAAARLIHQNYDPAVNRELHPAAFELAERLLETEESADAARSILFAKKMDKKQLKHTLLHYMEHYCQSNPYVDSHMKEAIKLLRLAGVRTKDPETHAILTPVLRSICAAGFATHAETFIKFIYRFETPEEVPMAFWRIIAVSYANDNQWADVARLFEALHACSRSRTHPISFTTTFFHVFRVYLSRNSIDQAFDYLLHATVHWGLVPTAQTSAMFIAACLAQCRYSLVEEWIASMRRHWPRNDPGMATRFCALQVRRSWDEIQASCEVIEAGCRAIASGAREDPFSNIFRALTREAVEFDLWRRLCSLIQSAHPEHRADLQKNLEIKAISRLIQTVGLVVSQPGLFPTARQSELNDLIRQVHALNRLDDLFGGKMPKTTQSPTETAHRRLHTRPQVAGQLPACFTDPKLPPRRTLWPEISAYYHSRQNEGLPIDHSILEYLIPKLLQACRESEAGLLLASVYSSPWVQDSFDGAPFTAAVFRCWLETANQLRSPSFVLQALWAIVDSARHIEVTSELIGLAKLVTVNAGRVYGILTGWDAHLFADRAKTGQSEDGSRFWRGHANFDEEGKKLNYPHWHDWPWENYDKGMQYNRESTYLIHKLMEYKARAVDGGGGENEWKKWRLWWQLIRDDREKEVKVKISRVLSRPPLVVAYQQHSMLDDGEKVASAAAA